MNTDRERGTTLVELVVTLGVSLVLVTLAAPDLTALRDQREEEVEVRALLDGLQLARSMARSRLRDVEVAIDEGALVLTPEGADTQRVELGRRLVSVEIGTASGRLTFDETGGTAEEDPTAVTVVTVAGRHRTITVYPAIGSLRLEAP